MANELLVASAVRALVPDTLVAWNDTTAPAEIVIGNDPQMVRVSPIPIVSQGPPPVTK